MPRLVLTILAALSLLAPDARAADRKADLAAAEKELAALEEVLDEVRKLGRYSPRDMRDRRSVDDVEQWAITPELLARARQILSRERNARDYDEVALLQARADMHTASQRMQEVLLYWAEVPALSWRQRWKAFAEANDVTGDPEDALLAADKVLLDALNAGEFVTAAVRLREVEAHLDKALSAATAARMRSLDESRVNYVQAKTPCAVRTGGERDRNAGLASAASPDAFYPPASKRRGERGVITLRVRLLANGCLNGIAVLMSSGFPDLDSAAIQVAEASRYSPATENGLPIDGQVTYKVRFTLR